jgi:hypothetical protein
MRYAWERLAVRALFSHRPSARTAQAAMRIVDRYWHAFSLNLILPLIPFLAGLISVGCAWAWARFIARRSILGLHLSFMCKDLQEVRKHLVSWLAISFPILHVLYGVLCVKALSTFFCVEMLDGSWALTAAPDIVCWEGDHIIMIFVSILAIILYVIGIPAYVFFILLYAHRHDKFKDAEWLQILGFLYTRYGNRSPFSARHIRPWLDLSSSHTVALPHGYLGWPILRRARILLVGADVPDASAFFRPMHGRTQQQSVRPRGKYSPIDVFLP